MYYHHNFDPSLAGLIVIFVLVLVVLAYTVFTIIAWAKIGRKCGYSPGWVAFLMCVPVLQTILFFVMAFKKEPWGAFADKGPKTAALEKRVAELEDLLAKKNGSSEEEREVQPESVGEDIDLPAE